MRKRSISIILLAAILVVIIIISAVAFKYRRETVRLREQLSELQDAFKSWRAGAGSVTFTNAMDKPDRKLQATADQELITPGDEESEELSELKFLLRERDEIITGLKNRLQELEQNRSAGRSFGDRREEYLKQLREQYPERYEQIRRRGETMRERMTVNISEQREFLDSMEVLDLPLEEQESHARLMEELSAIDEILNSMTEDMDAGDMRRLRMQVYRKLRGLRNLFETEREILLHDLAGQLGYDGGDAWQFVDYINYINEMTSARAIWRRRRTITE